MNQKHLGNWGEEKALEVLSKRGYSILAANYRTKFGEVDVIAWDGREIIVVEVKTRSGSGFGSPADAVTPAKLAKMNMVVLEFMARHDLECGVRVEVVTVGKGGATQVIDGIDFAG
jgi:putative endonuclease